MSNNPFESPQETPLMASPVSPGTTPPPVIPGAAIAITIICLIVGLLGLCGACFQGAALGFQSSLVEFTESIPQPPAQKEFNRINMAVQKTMLIPSIILLVINLIISGLMVWGSIGCLRRKPGGRSTLRLALLAAIFFAVIQIGVTIASYFVTVGGVNQGVADYQGEVPKATLEAMAQTGSVGALIGCALGSVFILAFLIFYVWARFYMGKPKLDPFYTG